ncbi:hypothetical protein ES703_20555 [subsurface metagenome]
MPIDLDISEIEWVLSNKDGGGPAGPDAIWAWAFGYNRDGSIRDETHQLIQAIEQYDRVRVGSYEIALGGRAKRLLSRTKTKKVDDVE